MMRLAIPTTAAESKATGHKDAQPNAIINDACEFLQRRQNAKLRVIKMLSETLLIMMRVAHIHNGGGI
jgi:hypothetical protein